MSLLKVRKTFCMSIIERERRTTSTGRTGERNGSHREEDESKWNGGNDKKYCVPKYWICFVKPTEPNGTKHRKWKRLQLVLDSTVIDYWKYTKTLIMNAEEIYSLQENSTERFKNGCGISKRLNEVYLIEYKWNPRNC